MYETIFPFALGVLMAWITWYPARYLDARREQGYFTTIIAIVAVGFVGFPLEDGDSRAIVYELGAMVVFVVLIILSKKANVLLLPVVWFAHGAWDLAYLVGQVPVDKPLWVVQLCVPYDWLLGGYLLGRVSAWRGSRNTVSPP